MGADLYIMSLFEPNRARHSPAFDAAVAKRNGAAPGSAEAQDAQREVETAYEAMYSQGYFRDSYNPGSVFWAMGLSWWNDVQTTDDGYFTLDEIRRLIAVIEERPITLERVSAHRAGKSGPKGENTDQDWFDYWTKDRAALLAFLRQALAMNEPVRASL